MWSRLDDALIDHRKIFHAAEVLGANGGAIALGMYAVGLMYANKHLTDGFLPLAVVRKFSHVADPVAVADALVAAGLWRAEVRDGRAGFVIHDFADFNPSASAIKARRRTDKVRKQRERGGGESPRKRRNGRG